MGNKNWTEITACRRKEKETILRWSTAKGYSFMFYLRERDAISLEFGVWKGKGMKLQEDSLSMKLYLDPTPRADAQDGNGFQLEKVATLCSSLFVQKFGSYHPEAIHLWARYWDTNLALFMTEKRGNMLIIFQK